MKTLWRRGVLTASLSLMVAVGGLLVAGTAHAQAVATGTLAFSGDAGDYISQGESYSYSTSNGDALSVSSSSGSLVSISVNAYNGDWWTLDIDAPAGSVLAPGTYTAAHRYPFNGTGPGLSLTGNGRGCNTLTGSFTIIDAVFGAQGYVQTFDATFVQNCEGGTPAARGTVHISNPPPPAGAAQSPAAATNAHPAASSGPGAPAARGGNSASSSIGASNSDPASSSSAIGSRDPVGNAGRKRLAALGRDVNVPVLVGVGIVTWAVLVAIGLGVGLGVPLRRQ